MKHLNAALLDLTFGQAILHSYCLHVRALKQQGANIAWRFCQEPLEPRGLTSVSPKVTGVEEAAASGLHQQCIGVKGTVVHQVGGHREWSELDRNSVDQVSCGCDLSATA